MGRSWSHWSILIKDIELSPAEEMDSLLIQIRGCTHCANALPLGPRPVLRASTTARLLIVGQAPGTRVHESGIPWNDASGKRLRQWLDIDEATFYDERRVAIMPMGFCYPGKGKSGDLPPRSECAPLWHSSVRALMPDIRLTLLIGQYAQQGYLSDKQTLTARVKSWRDYQPAFWPLPHPSPRNGIWLQSNLWFLTEVLPSLQKTVRELLSTE